MTADSNMPENFRPEVKLQRFTPVEEGSRLELFTEFNGMGQIVATILADESDESLWLEVEVNGRLVQVPLTLVKKAIELAATEVHSERWFDENASSKGSA